MLAFGCYTGPIGNAASFQSVPELTTQDGSWSANPFLPGWDPEKMSRLSLVVANGTFIDVPILNVSMPHAAFSSVKISWQW